MVESCEGGEITSGYRPRCVLGTDECICICWIAHHEHLNELVMHHRLLVHAMPIIPLWSTWRIRPAPFLAIWICAHSQREDPLWTKLEMGKIRRWWIIVNHTFLSIPSFLGIDPARNAKSTLVNASFSLVTASTPEDKESKTRWFRN